LPHEAVDRRAVPLVIGIAVDDADLRTAHLHDGSQPHVDRQGGGRRGILREEEDLAAGRGRTGMDVQLEGVVVQAAALRVEEAGAHEGLAAGLTLGQDEAQQSLVAGLVGADVGRQQAAYDHAAVDADLITDPAAGRHLVAVVAGP